jgi:A/G-specific adenine glycosylase
VIDSVAIHDRNSALLAWYANNARDLPWRRTVNPYSTLVSEVMLQQTQVDRVIPKFEAFMQEFPTVERLASADTNRLLAVWSGLGYNSRALRLRDAAVIIAARGWPNGVDALAELPGIGPYTAAAIASISFGHDVPAVDTNLKRVLGRWIGEPLTGSALVDAANSAMGVPAGYWNQALMDLGSSYCRPREPRCQVCPVAPWCTDPSVYESPKKQRRFKGSRRELRGALVHAHVAGDDPVEAGRRLGRTDEEVASTLLVLRDEGLVV